MNKPGRLRATLLAHHPDLASDPQKLAIFVSRGNLVATGEPGGGWEYGYTLTMIVQDFAGDMDALSATVLDWLAVEQPDLLKSPDARARSVRFEAELLSNELADVQIELDLQEAVQRRDGQFIHPPAPPADPSALW